MLCLVNLDKSIGPCEGKKNRQAARVLAGMGKRTMCCSLGSVRIAGGSGSNASRARDGAELNLGSRGGALGLHGATLASAGMCWRAAGSP